MILGCWGIITVNYKEEQIKRENVEEKKQGGVFFRGRGGGGLLEPPQILGSINQGAAIIINTTGEGQD